MCSKELQSATKAHFRVFWTFQCLNLLQPVLQTASECFKVPQTKQLTHSDGGQKGQILVE